ncbi:hypothetical protein [Granulicella arctica]|uniref:hypothetical protein n=1 Tax=Granulicella arctica TaxID=940613 RepID=UPI0021DFADC7|nr:hypothetical protein [Granulicella arctica]
MLKGVHLTLLIGPGVPVPVPQSVMDALVSVSVNSGKEKTGFQVTFALSKNSPLLQYMLPAGYFDPMTTRVIIIATVNSLPNVIMDGIVTRQELSPSNEPGQSTLTITGEDLSVVMDVVEMNYMRYPAMPEMARLYVIMAKYAAFGITPILLPPIPPSVPPPTNKIPTHRGTDLYYMRWMARKCGYTFYIDPGPLPGQSIAYFGPDVRIPVPQSALSINMDAHTNVEQMTFSLDGLSKKIIIYTIHVEGEDITIPAPNLSVLRPPMGLRLPAPSKIEYADDGANKSMAEGLQEILGMTFNASNSVTVSGTLDVLRYGGILRNRLMVGVRGAGLTYDGLYYVDSVTHSIKRGEYKQTFQLSRDGLITNTPKVFV